MPSFPVENRDVACNISLSLLTSLQPACAQKLESYRREVEWFSLQSSDDATEEESKQNDAIV